jgi:hypothetical protein
MMKTISYEVKGFPPAMATNLATEHQIGTSTNHAFGVLDEYLDQCSLTLATATLSAGVDIYNHHQNKTFQAGDKWSLMHKATTVMYL